MKRQTPSRTAVLLIHCPDQKGLVLAVTDFIYKNNGNVVYLDQHVDPERRLFFMRIEWDVADFTIPDDKIGETFGILMARKYRMKWQLYFSDEKPRMAVYVSSLSHCLVDILHRMHSGGWKAELPVIISDQPDLEPVARKSGIAFSCIPVTAGNKREAEKAQLRVLRAHRVELVVLARYMQILSPEFISQYPSRIIGIHHSFLPAFPGAKPYHSAHERGVKIIGATSHYVTGELDAGPIIEQDVTRISHADTVDDLVRKGHDLEKRVLSAAVWLHLQRKILTCGNRTVIFS
ncbi:MAG: formyltetrahydrofolate deformylase [bacterium]|nr:formyltetrahydrofolate deformylase [bacterium]